LVRHVFGLLRDRQVPWVVLENVPFMLQLERGRAMRHVVEELEELGYRWAYRVVDAMAFGLPQRRRRVFVVASRQGDPERVLFADEAKPRAVKEWTPKVPAGFYWTEGNRGVGWAVGAIPTLKGGSGLGIPSAPAVLMPRGDVLTPDIEGAERLQGFPAGWTAAGAWSATP
jgi:DNA (cytosine-5)-methyltransferase 1